MQQQQLLFDERVGQRDALFAGFQPLGEELPLRKEKKPLHFLWAIKGLFAAIHSFQWGGFVLAVAQMLEEEDPAVPRFIIDYAPPLSILIAGYATNFMVPLALVQFEEMYQEVKILASEFKGAKIRSTCIFIFSLMYISCGVMFCWPVVSDPVQLTNQSYPWLANLYHDTNANAVANNLNKLLFILTTIFMMEPSGFSLARFTVEELCNYFSSNARQEQYRIGKSLELVFQDPDLNDWVSWLEEKRVQEVDPPDLMNYLETVSPQTLAMAAMYSYSRRSTCKKTGCATLNLVMIGVLSYGLIPFILFVFRWVWPGIALMATMTNFVLTCFLSNEIIVWMNNLSAKKMRCGHYLVVAFMALYSAYLLCFSALIYLPSALQEKLADCAYAANVTNMTLSSNQTIACPDYSPLLFGMQVVLSVLNPTLLNLAFMLMLLIPFYHEISKCMARLCEREYRALFNKMRFLKMAKEKLADALMRDGDFINKITASLLARQSPEAGALLYCSIVFAGQPRIYSPDSESSAKKVLEEMAGQEVSLPTDFDDTAPFQTRKWSVFGNAIQLIFLGTAFAYFWLTYDGSDGVIQTPRLPKLDTPEQVAIVLACTFLAGLTPDALMLTRLACNKQTDLSIYTDKNTPCCGKGLGPIVYVRPVFSRLAYVAVFILSSCFVIAPILFLAYLLAVMLLEVWVELDLLDRDEGPQEVVAAGFQSLLLIGLASLVVLLNQLALRAGSEASCNQTRRSGDPDFSGFLLTEQPGTKRAVVDGYQPPTDAPV